MQLNRWGGIMEYIVVGIGGIFGSIFRFIIGKLITKRSNTVFPIGTFIINFTGAFLLGILNSLMIDKTVYTLLGDGFLGAFTTFSTFMYEGFNLFQDREKMNAFIYVFGTILLGITGYSIGHIFGRIYSSFLLLLIVKK